MRDLSALLLPATNPQCLWVAWRRGTGATGTPRLPKKKILYYTAYTATFV
jgi:hypothetical protein